MLFVICTLYFSTFAALLKNLYFVLMTNSYKIAHLFGYPPFLFCGEAFTRSMA